MKKRYVLASVLLSGSLAACSTPDDAEVDADPGGTTETPSTPADSSDSSTADGQETENDGEADDSDTNSSDAGSGNTDSGDVDDSQASDNSSGDSADSAETSIDAEQKQMALDTLKELVSDAKEGKVYRFGDAFYVGKTTQTDVYNEIGKPERQDTFDRYTGSMGQASYDLRYDTDGVLAEARYLGTNVERQTNLGGITPDDLNKQLGQPEAKRAIPDTNQTSYIYTLDSYQLQFVMNEKNTADHVNLLMN